MLDDLADGALETLRERIKLGLARRRQLAILRIALDSLLLGLGHRLNLEFLHCAGHLADFIPAIEARQLDRQISGGQFVHRLGHHHHRLRNTAPDQEREQQAKRGNDAEHNLESELLLFEAHLRNADFHAFARAARAHHVRDKLRHHRKLLFRILDESRIGAGSARLFDDGLRLRCVDGDGILQLGVIVLRHHRARLIQADLKSRQRVVDTAKRRRGVECITLDRLGVCLGRRCRRETIQVGMSRPDR
ncbi:hypothetical protein BN961_02020 [Afipia felis]|uniref:Uncharacterized protein n=1 Tax=Afipia felis TaxID=1035 RepID=A0A090MSJ8_AFIFE|nr:hypothetical protein BN961_02020 [Afipia felis]